MEEEKDIEMEENNDKNETEKNGIDGRNNEIEIKLPYSSRPCPICIEENKGTFVAISVKGQVAHINDCHKDYSIIFVCAKCGKNFKRQHSAECHVPKCPGLIVIHLPYKCEECDKAFSTRRGLSQHHRHGHPAVRNEARMASSSSAAEPARKAVFTDSEIQMMLTMEADHYGDRLIAKKMSEVLSSKTAKQIRDKRRDAKYKNLRYEHLKQKGIVSQELQVDDQSEAQSDSPGPLSPIPTPSTCADFVMSDEDEIPWRNSVLRIAYSLRPATGLVDGALPEKVNLVVTGLRSCIDVIRSMGESSYQSEVDTATQLVSSYILGNALTSKTRDKINKIKSSDGNRKKSRKRPRRKYIYARTQTLYKENPGLLAKFIREGKDWINNNNENEESVSIKEVADFYDKLWNNTSNMIKPQWEVPSERLSIGEVLSHITLKEISTRISRLAGKVAPGPDGIKKPHLRGKYITTLLQILFNIILATGKQPTQWKQNNTTLILKDGKNGDDVRNYRPISIGSLLNRVFWGIIDQKLRASLRTSFRQKGFTSESGCFNNVHILNEIIKLSKDKQRKNGLVTVLLDISKAFDTVPHGAVGPALRRKGLPEFVVRMLENSYDNVYTSIRLRGETVSIALKRGIKQGDPISPLVFNLIFEPLLDSLEDLQGFRIDESTSISCLAFADDLTLTANSKLEMQQLLSCVTNFLNALGMTLSAGKCLCFQIKPTRDTWCVVDPALRIPGGDQIPLISAEDRVRYLGMQISPWTGIDISDIKDALYTSCQRVKKLYLKPHQKVNLISTYLVPHYLYPMSIALPGITLVREMDEMLRVVVKEIYHLPQSTPNGLLYCGKRDGGLGFPKLEILSSSSGLRTGLKFMNSEDPVIKALAAGSGMIARLKKVANSVRINWPITNIKEIDDFKIRAKKAELANWSSLKALGRGAKEFEDDDVGNAWLYNPSLLKPCRFLTALKLRGNVAGDRVSLKRAKVVEDSSCRKCITQTESLAHILGQCIHTKGLRIRRHDEIRDLIAKEAGSKDLGLTVMKEPSFKTSSGKSLQPDLVIQSQEGVQVVDVTVRHEDGDYLERGRKEKIEKYEELIPLLSDRLNCVREKVSIKPVVVGTRGAMPRESKKVLEEIGIKNKQTLKTIALIALRSSIEIYHQFMDYDASRVAR